MSSSEGLPYRSFLSKDHIQIVHESMTQRRGVHGNRSSTHLQLRTCKVVTLLGFIARIRKGDPSYRMHPARRVGSTRASRELPAARAAPSATVAAAACRPTPSPPIVAAPTAAAARRR